MFSTNFQVMPLCKDEMFTSPSGVHFANNLSDLESFIYPDG